MMDNAFRFEDTPFRGFDIRHGVCNLNAHPLDPDEFNNGYPVASCAYVELTCIEKIREGWHATASVAAWGGGA